jgi:hypothetical protein
MSDIINFDAIPEEKRAEAKLNILTKFPNDQLIDVPANPDFGKPKYTDMQWLNRLVWDFLKRLNKKGHDIRVRRSASEAIDIENE